MARFDHLMKWYATSSTRQEAFAEYMRASGERWTVDNLMTTNQYRNGLQMLNLKPQDDDRPWNDTSHRGGGNRWKRRMGWVLFQGSCMHSGWEYDCCCEPRSYYVDWREVIDDRKRNKIRTYWNGKGKHRQRRGWFVQEKYWTWA